MKIVLSALIFCLFVSFAFSAQSYMHDEQNWPILISGTSNQLNSVTPAVQLSNAGTVPSVKVVNHFLVSKTVKIRDRVYSSSGTLGGWTTRFNASLSPASDSGAISMASVNPSSRITIPRAAGSVSASAPAGYEMEVWADDFDTGERIGHYTISISGSINVNSTYVTGGTTLGFVSSSGDVISNTSVLIPVSAPWVLGKQVVLTLEEYVAPIEVDLDATDLEGGKVSLYVDTDGDGIYEKVWEADLDENGNAPSLPNNPAWNGKPYKAYLESFSNVVGHTVPVQQQLGSGTYTASGATIGGTISSHFDPEIPIISVGPSGSVSNGQIVRSATTVNGTTSHNYTFYNSAGNPTTISYADDGSSAVTAGDIRTASAQNSAENTKIFDELHSLGGKLDQIATNTAPVPTPTPTATPSPTPSPSSTPTATPSPTPTPTPDPAYDTSDDISYDVSAADLGGAANTPASVSVSSNPNLWIVYFPGSSTPIDLNPMHQPLFVGFFSWFRTILYWLFSIWICWHAYKRINQLGRDLFDTTQGADVSKMAKMQANNQGVRGVISRIPGLGWIANGFIKIVLSFVNKAAIVAALLLFAGMAWAFFGPTGDLVHQWLFGGKSLIASLALAVIPTSPALREAVFLLTQFIPVDHIFTCGCVWLTIEAIAFAVHITFAFAVRAFTILIFFLALSFAANAGTIANCSTNAATVELTLEGGATGLIYVPPLNSVPFPNSGLGSVTTETASDVSVDLAAVSVISVSPSGAVAVCPNDPSKWYAMKNGITLAVPVFAWCLGIWLFRRGVGVGNGALGEDS